jgi:hypothetical protein
MSICIQASKLAAEQYHLMQYNTVRHSHDTTATARRGAARHVFLYVGGLITFDRRGDIELVLCRRN